MQEAEEATPSLWSPAVAMVVSSSVALAAHAEEAAVAADAAVLAVTETPEVAATLEAAAAPLSTPGELAVIAAPLVLYGIFNGYRSFVNPKATFNDFLFLTVALGIVYNIVSIVVFKISDLAPSALVVTAGNGAEGVDLLRTQLERLSTELQVMRCQAAESDLAKELMVAERTLLIMHLQGCTGALDTGASSIDADAAVTKVNASAAIAEVRVQELYATLGACNGSSVLVHNSALLPHIRTMRQQLQSWRKESEDRLAEAEETAAAAKAESQHYSQAMHSAERALSEIQHQHAELTQLHSSQTTEQQHR
ncbi:MAG: hypothetical protein WDW38_003276 [Sanguina aurantia]